MENAGWTEIEGVFLDLDLEPPHLDPPESFPLAKVKAKRMGFEVKVKTRNSAKF
jgi:hypothetical protein